MAGEAAHHTTTQLCAISQIGIGKQCQHSGGRTTSPLSFVLFAHKYVIKYHTIEPLARYFHWRIILPNYDRSKGMYRADIARYAYSPSWEETGHLKEEIVRDFFESYASFYPNV
jgi:hypothetical protein